MAMAGIFGLFAATYYWFPLVTGRLMSEPLGRWHFWLTLLAAYGCFLPMHITGLKGEPRHYAQLTGLPGTAASHLLAPTLPLNLHITVFAFVLAASQILFLLNLLLSWRGADPASSNPWQATTLEWHPALDPRRRNTLLEAEPEPIEVFRRPCHYATKSNQPHFLPQWESAATPETESE